MPPMPSEELLATLCRRESRFGSYEELEMALTEVMNELRDRISAHIDARDVLDYGARHGMIRRQGQSLVVTLQQAPTAA